MKIASAEFLMKKVRQRAFKPRTRLNTWQWAGKHVYLDERFTARPGLFDVNFTPYMKGPHEWFSDPHVEEISFAKSRQVAGTTFLGNCLSYAIGEDPGPALYVTATLDKARSYSEREWKPRVELSPILKELKPDNKDDFKKIAQHFKSCSIEFTGSNSPANLMSRPVRYLFEDEIDTWPKDNGEEAPSINIAEASTISYAHSRKILRVSTPTVPTGAIWTFFQKGTQHKYHVPCPHCGQKFELLFEQLNFHRELNRSETGVWDLDGVRDTASLTCPNAVCKADISMRDQPYMVLKGEWVQTNPNAPKRHISCHISALYSPTITWGQIAVLFLQQCDTPGGLHDFYNHYLGLPFTRASTSVTITDVERVRDASPEYRLFDIKNAHSWRLPAHTEFAVMAVDVQQDGFWWGHRGLCLDETSYLLDYGRASTWDDLDELIARVYKQPDGTPLKIYKGLIDCGYIAKRMGGVYDFCIRSGGRFLPCQGRSITHGLYQPIRETQFDHKGYLLDAVQLRDDLYKEQLYIRRIKERAGAGWYLPRNIDMTYCKQLTDEKLEPKKTERGTEIMDWKDHGNNHLGDVEKYLLAAIDLLVPYVRAKRDGLLEIPPDEKPRVEESTGMRVLETIDDVLARQIENAQSGERRSDPFAVVW
jgi:phage terminase large subunit GpA-like protein